MECLVLRAWKPISKNYTKADEHKFWASISRLRATLLNVRKFEYIYIVIHIYIGINVLSIAGNVLLTLFVGFSRFNGCRRIIRMAFAFCDDDVEGKKLFVLARKSGIANRCHSPIKRDGCSIARIGLG